MEEGALEREEGMTMVMVATGMTKVTATKADSAAVDLLASLAVWLVVLLVLSLEVVGVVSTKIRTVIVLLHMRNTAGDLSTIGEMHMTKSQLMLPTQTRQPHMPATAVAFHPTLLVVGILAEAEEVAVVPLGL